MVGRCCRRAALSEPPDQAGRSVCGRRATRHRRADHRRQAVGQPQAAIRDREPARRGRQHRNRSHRKSGARRIHAGDGARHDADRESEPLQEAALRPGQGLQADLNRHHVRQHAGRASVHSGQFGGGVRRLREGRRRKEGAHHLCQRRHRNPRPSGDGEFSCARRVRGDPCALPRQCADGHRSRGRAGQGRLRHHCRHDGSCAGGTTEGLSAYRVPAVRRSRRMCRRSPSRAIPVSGSKTIT